LVTARLPCPPTAAPLDAYAVHFDELFASLAQRRGFRDYLAGLLAPRDRNKTLTALAGAEPVVGAQHRAVQRLQYFLSEAAWDADAVNARRLELLLADPATAAHDRGVLVIDDSGDRKDGTATAHVGRQYLGRIGKTDNGIVTVTTLWADERVYYPLHAKAYTPAHHFGDGRADAGFATKLQIAADLVQQAKDAGVVCRAVVADCFYGDYDQLRGGLSQAGLGFVMALKPHRGSWQYRAEAYTPVDAARAVPAFHSPDDPGGWTAVTRRYRDGHTDTWWAADARLGWWGPDGHTRLVVATVDPQTLPDKATWYLACSLPLPASRYDSADNPHPPADLAEVVRLYGLRDWIEQSYKQVKTELGWADFQVRSATAIHRHQTLVNCAFSFCWNSWFDEQSTPDTAEPATADPQERGANNRHEADSLLAQGITQRPRLADTLDHATKNLESLVAATTPRRAASPPRRRSERTKAILLPPTLTNYR
jgi:SRSO17 transposase